MHVYACNESQNCNRSVQFNSLLPTDLVRHGLSTYYVFLFFIVVLYRISDENVMFSFGSYLALTLICYVLTHNVLRRYKYSQSRSMYMFVFLATMLFIRN